MPAAAPIALGVGALASGVSGAIKSGRGAKEAREARRAIESYERQPLENIFRDTQISRLGTDLQREEQGRFSASALDALRRGGIRGLVGGVGQLTQQSNLFNKQIASELDRQQKELDMLRAQDEASMRAIKEERDRQNLAGLGQQLQTGRAMQQQGLQTALGSVPQLAYGVAGAFKPN